MQWAKSKLEGTLVRQVANQRVMVVGFIAGLGFDQRVTQAELLGQVKVLKQVDPIEV